jgi:hypothetical protein
MEIVGAICIAVGVAIAELLGRYRHVPASRQVTLSIILYLLVHAVAALVAILLIGHSDHSTSSGATAAGTSIGDTLIAGFGATAFLRSSFFVHRVGDQDVQIGPAAILNALLTAADRELDRSLAQKRGTVVPGIMGKVNFEKAYTALPAVCFTLMQNVTKAEQEDIGDAVEALASSAMSNTAKSISLGLLMTNVVGTDVLELAVAALGDTIT